MKKAIRAALIIILVYAVYVVITAVLPYYGGKGVKTPANASSYYGNGSASVDRVALVEQPLESLGARIYLLGEADKTIDISYYSIQMGQTTDLFLGAILDAADRGVKVRLLVDGMSGGLTPTHSAYAAALGAHENIDLRIYNRPNPLKPWTFNGRLHDKYIIVDDRIMLLGGRNIGDKYFNPNGFSGNLSIDRDVLVYNTDWENGADASVLSAVRAYMDSVFYGDNVKQIYQKDTKRGSAKREMLRETIADAKANYAGLFVHDTDYIAATYPVNKISFIHNGTEIGPKEPIVADAIGALLLGADESVLLQSPYFVLDRMLGDLLNELGQKDISYEILTNSMGSSPNLPAFSAYCGDRDRILETGAMVMEYQSRHAIHAKSYLIDDRMSVVGSFNFDPRSAYVDTELMLAIDSEEFAAKLHETMDSYAEQALVITEDGYIADDDVDKQPVFVLKRCLMAIISVVIRPFKMLV